MGGGIGMGNTCKPMADSFQCTTKPTTIKKKIKKIKKNKRKKKRLFILCFPHKGGVICISEVIDISPSNLGDWQKRNP